MHLESSPNTSGIAPTLRAMTGTSLARASPMLYVGIQDVCNALRTLAGAFLDDVFAKDDLSTRAINLMSPRPITIIELAKIVQKTVLRVSRAEIEPIEAVERH